MENNKPTKSLHNEKLEWILAWMREHPGASFADAKTAYHIERLDNCKHWMGEFGWRCDGISDGWIDFFGEPSYEENYRANIETLLLYFEKPVVLEFLLNYMTIFRLDNEQFQRLVRDIIETAGSKWTEILLQQHKENRHDCILRTAAWTAFAPDPEEAWKRELKKLI